MEHTFAFTQKQDAPITFKQWCAVVEDAKQLATEYSVPSNIELYRRMDHTWIDPSADQLHQNFSSLDFLCVEMYAERSRPNMFSSLPDSPMASYVKLSHITFNTGELDFLIYTDDSALIEGFIDRFADSALDGISRSIRSLELSADRDTLYSSIHPIEFQC